MFGRPKKRFDRKQSAVQIFHGTDRELRPEEFDFYGANNDSDLGKAAYFGLSYDSADDWARAKGNGTVNWYIFDVKGAENDDSLTIRHIDDPMEMLDTVLLFIDGRYGEPEDIIIGDTLDATTGIIIRRYQKEARRMGIPMSRLSIEIKEEMLLELRLEIHNQQIAFKTGQGLKHVKFIGSKGANEMGIVRDLDPAEIAAKVAGLLMGRDGMTQNEALTAFMKSDTFRALVSDAELSSLGPERILEMYDREVDRG